MSSGNDPNEKSLLTSTPSPNKGKRNKKNLNRLESYSEDQGEEVEAEESVDQAGFDKANKVTSTLMRKTALNACNKNLSYDNDNPIKYEKDSDDVINNSDNLKLSQSYENASGTTLPSDTTDSSLEPSAIVNISGPNEVAKKTSKFKLDFDY